MKVKWDKSCWIVWQQKRIFDRQISGVCLGGGYVNEGCMSVLGCWMRHFRKLFLWSRRNLLDVTGAVDWPYPPFFFHSPCPSSFSHISPPLQWSPSASLWKFSSSNFPSSTVFLLQSTAGQDRRDSRENPRGKKKAYNIISIQLPR